MALARETLDIEAAALLGLKQHIGPDFVQVVRLMLAVQGRVVVMGMGKSGHVGRKIAATLASTGTPAMFVHPGEASHGDLGMIKPMDLVLAISNSGESEELTAILPMIKRLGAPLAIIHKRRDPDRPNQVEAHELVGDVKGRTCLLVDDMIDTAGTIVAAAQALKNNGAARVIVAATHAVFSSPAVERLSSGVVDEVIVTNTLPITREKQFDNLTVLSIAPLIAAAISAVFGDDSVNKLFPGHA